MNMAAPMAVHDLSELEMIDIAHVKLDPVWVHAIPVASIRRFQAIGLCRVNGEVIVATCNPRIAAVHDFLTQRLNAPFRLVRTEDTSFRRVLRQVFPQQPTSAKLSDDAERCETVGFCDELLRDAILRGASDIHLIPEENGLRAKFRVDGILEEYRNFPTRLQAELTSRIKVLAGLNIAEKREPQDGRFSIREAGVPRPTDIRVATIPTRYGERVTLRLLSLTAGTLSLSDLGMDEAQLEQFTQAISSNHGLVLLTGPTGCGKSTTLYAAITQLLTSRGGNVITIEDPIEYEIAGATQVEVDSADKVSFSRALRSILRHDPDVIMLGEIRDTETAELAIKASLTGHLVFSTLHTNTAAGAVTRLVDMGVEPFLIGATLRLAVAQRLVRRLCPKCSRPACLSETDARLLGCPPLSGHRLFEATGCVYCAGKGFVGRFALFEMLPGGSELAELVTAHTTESGLTEYMCRINCNRMVNDGINKVLTGATSVQQVLSAVTMW